MTDWLSVKNVAVCVEVDVPLFRMVTGELLVTGYWTLVMVQSYVMVELEAQFYCKKLFPILQALFQPHLKSCSA